MKNPVQLLLLFVCPALGAAFAVPTTKKRAGTSTVALQGTKPEAALYTVPGTLLASFFFVTHQTNSTILSTRSGFGHCRNRPSNEKDDENQKEEEKVCHNTKECRFGTRACRSRFQPLFVRSRRHSSGKIQILVRPERLYEKAKFSSYTCAQCQLSATIPFTTQPVDVARSRQGGLHWQGSSFGDLQRRCGSIHQLGTPTPQRHCIE